MKDAHVDPLPPDIAALLEREARAYPEDPALKDAVLSHLELAVGLGGPPGGSSGGGSGGSADPGQAPGAASAVARAAIPGGARLIAAVGVSTFVLGGVVGGLAVKALSPTPVTAPAVASAPARMTPPPADASPTGSAAPPAAEVPAPAASGSAPPSSPSGAASAAPPRARGDLTRERELLDAAHAALARGRATDALALAERHAEQWPRGYLGEEREVVRIQALAASGRRGEAQQRAAQFRATHPKSVLLPAVDAAVPAEK